MSLESSSNNPFEVETNGTSSQSQSDSQDDIIPQQHRQPMPSTSPSDSFLEAPPATIEINSIEELTNGNGAGLFNPNEVIVASAVSTTAATPTLIVQSTTTPTSTSTTSGTTTHFMSPSTHTSTAGRSSYPSNSPSSSTSSSSDSMLTPRSLARKIAAHQARPASPPPGTGPSEQEPSSVDEPTIMEIFDQPALARMANEDAPRFLCAIGNAKIKDDGIKTHTRYEIVTKWKQSLVDASAAAIAAAKSKSQSDEDTSSSAPATAASPSTSATAPALPLLKIPSVSRVFRRYTDFVTLQSLLTQLFPSYLIPCLPPKSLLQRFDADFLMQRRRGLQRFLKDLSQMPEALTAERLISEFLIAGTREWESVCSHAQSLNPNNSASAKANWLLQGTMSFTSKLLTQMGAKSGAQSDAELYAHDEHYTNAIDSAAYHQQLQLQYDHLNTMFEHVVNNERELAEAWLEWYPGFEEADDSLQSSRIERTHDLLGLDFAAFLPLTQRIGLISYKKSESEVSSISELLSHTCGMIHQIQELFKRRQAISQAVSSAEVDVKAAEHKLEMIKNKVQLGSKTAADEESVTNQLAQCRAILRDRQTSLTTFHTIAEEQIRRYTQERRAEMKNVIIDFIRLQLSHEENMKNHFQRLLTQLEKQK